MYNLVLSTYVKLSTQKYLFFNYYQDHANKETTATG